MSKKTNTIIEEEKPLHPIEVERLVEQGKQLDNVANYVYDVILMRISLLQGNLFALRELYDNSAPNSKERAKAESAIINNMFAVCAELEYECELISEVHFDELAERHDVEEQKVLL